MRVSLNLYGKASTYLMEGPIKLIRNKTYLLTPYYFVLKLCLVLK